MIDFTWLVGGPQGSGVESGANIFTRVCAETGYNVFGKREFYSNIKGEHSYFTVRISDESINSATNGINLMASFDAETIFRHFDSVLPGGGIIYDSDLDNVDTSRVLTLDGIFKERLHAFLESKDKPFTISGALEVAKENGVSLYPVSFKTLLANLAEKAGNPRLRGLIRMYNVIAVSLSLGLLGMSSKILLNSIGKIFAKKPSIAMLNKQAATYSYDYMTESFPRFSYELPTLEKQPQTILIQGFQGTALGKMACGCRLQPYYPITPASDESFYLESNAILDVHDDSCSGSTTVIQTEDEICAIGMTIGGSLTGARSSTCTSGPGFSLMAEALGWAAINEVPIVVTNYQRSGPSTGLPTRHGQDDLLFSVHAGHGDFPRIVYASGTIEESFYDTGRCFNYADMFQVPVIHMMDKFLASSVVTCKRFDAEKIVINRGKMLKSSDKTYKRFQITPDGISPRSYLGADDAIFWTTGDESDEYGHITEDPIMRMDMMDKRMSRLDLILNHIPESEQAISYGIHDYTIITWGSAKGPILDAVKMLDAEGIEIGLIEIKLLHPFPTRYIKLLIENVKTLIDVEANHHAQMGKLLKMNTGREPDYNILKYTGRSITCTEIYDSLKKIVQNKIDKNKRRIILKHGA